MTAPSLPAANSEALPGLSLIIPVYKNEANIADLLTVLHRFHQRYGDRFEAILVVDGSPDRSWQLLHDGLQDSGIPCQLLLLARNFGSFLAIRRGLEVARHEITAVMAADLQEPPELIDSFYEALAADEADLAIGVRTERSDGRISAVFSSIFWGLFRRIAFRDVPKGGVDVFGCNRKFRDSLLSLQENNTSLIGQLFWVGFRRIEFPYARLARTKGKSSWTFRGRIRYMLDSVFAFSDVPITALLWIGALGAAVSVLAGGAVLVSYLTGHIDRTGYTPIILSVLFTGSLVLIGQGIVGAYVWRAVENAKRRPLTITATHEVFPDE
jgi:glycosyltransferase involved in cell wall biosynthesis